MRVPEGPQRKGSLQTISAGTTCAHLRLPTPRCPPSSPLKQRLVQRNQPRPDGSQRKTCRRKRQRKLIIVHRQIPVSAVYLPNRHAHLESQQKRRRPRKQSQQQQPAAERLQNPRDVQEIARQSMLHEKI